MPRWSEATTLRPVQAGIESTIPGDPARRAESVEQLRAAVAENPNWYHTIELASGVVTPGHVDMRKLAPRILPERLDGRRAVDVGTFDGFWAFEMERRGAADVVAIDIDEPAAAEWPPLSRARLIERVEELSLELGRGFEIAKRSLDSDVARVICNVYDLEPGVIGGEVDDVFLGTLLLHLRDPVGALERVLLALRPGGRLHLLETVSPSLTLRSPRVPAARFRAANSPFNWWVPNIAAVRAWVRAAGFHEIERLGLFRPPSTAAMRQFYVAYTATRPPA